VTLEIALAEENDSLSLNLSNQLLKHVADLEDPLAEVNFKPLYQCLLVHHFLGQKDQLQAEYEDIRKVEFINLLLLLKYIESS
jgi:hypothetical protein